MNIISYRGPCSPGGVSGTLARIYANHASVEDRWWYVSGSTLLTMQKDDRIPAAACQIPQKIIAGHYRYCNEFLWPILHDMPEIAVYSAENRQLYQKFNLSVAGNVANLRHLRQVSASFVNDYQFALLPSLLGAKHSVTAFWHIPWPMAVPDCFAPALAEIAEGLLGSTTLGFHIKEYALNFLHFVSARLPQYAVDFDRQIVYARRPALTPEATVAGPARTKVVVQPLGIDIGFWNNLSRTEAAVVQPGIMKMKMEMDVDRPFILSVDRTDYTKGILHRLASIDKFFEKYPAFVGQVNFLQLCQATRSGLPAFDRYFQACRAEADRLNARWAAEDWQPVIWIDQPIDASGLSRLYRDAAALLVTPLRDGLNLTVKEFIACSDVDPGVLLLSPGTGVWHEVGKHALSVIPERPEQVADQILLALSMPREERLIRSKHLKHVLETNTLEHWWEQFGRSKLCLSNEIMPYKEGLG
jgi:trehalose-6-phosphate synthase